MRSEFHFEQPCNTRYVKVENRRKSICFSGPALKTIKNPCSKMKIARELSFRVKSSLKFHYNNFGHYPLEECRTQRAVTIFAYSCAILKFVG